MLLVADSGGTRTDWCLVDEKRNRRSFETVSYHPNYWNETFFDEQRAYWASFDNVERIRIHFYGAGCLAQQRQEQLISFFLSCGFLNVQVSSDIHAAGIAAYGNGEGLVAILGTGSVAAQIANEQVNSIIGGLGYILGDEGSGFYFGKLLVQEYLQGGSVSGIQEVRELLGDRTSIISSVYGTDGRIYLAELAHKLSHLELTEIRFLHQQNIKKFLRSLPDLRKYSELTFVGSYAHYRQQDIRTCLADQPELAIHFIEKPIERLTEYLLRTTF